MLHAATANSTFIEKAHIHHVEIGYALAAGFQIGCLSLEYHDFIWKLSETTPSRIKLGS